jgi:undecaprenyl-diphosphatase
MSAHFFSTLRRRWRAFVLARLSPEGVAGLHLSIGLVALLLATTAFGAIAEDVVTGDRLTVLDVVIANWFHAHATPAMTTLMLAVSNLHGSVGGVVLSDLLLGFY